MTIETQRVSKQAARPLATENQIKHSHYVERVFRYNTESVKFVCEFETYASDTAEGVQMNFG